MGNIEKFDYIANQYDTPERIEITKIIVDTIRAYIIDGQGKDAIDYGCGTGLVGMQLLNDFASMLFIDASSNMIEQVKEKMNELNINNAKALYCDFMTQCPKTIHADYVILVQTLLHIKEVEEILSCLYSVLNEGGHLLIVDFDKNDKIISDEIHHGFDQGELINIIENIGFLNARSKTFYTRDKIFMGKESSLFILDAIK